MQPTAKYAGLRFWSVLWNTELGMLQVTSGMVFQKGITGVESWEAQVEGEQITLILPIPWNVQTPHEVNASMEHVKTRSRAQP